MVHAAGMSRKPRISFETKSSSAEDDGEPKLLEARKEGRLLSESEGERAAGDDEDRGEDSVATYRGPTVAWVVSRVENVLYAPDVETGRRIVWCDETHEKLNEFSALALRVGGVHPADLVRFLTADPNPAAFCALPGDRLMEVTSGLIDVGIRDKSLLSVMFHDNHKVFENPVSRIWETLETLRQRGLALSETLPTILIDCPGLLVDFDEADWNERKEWFDWNFTSRSFREFLITQPQVLFSPLADVEDKFK